MKAEGEQSIFALFYTFKIWSTFYNPFKLFSLLQSVFDISEPLIQNGQDTNISVVPWQASLRWVYDNPNKNWSKERATCQDEGIHFCGGSIVSDQHILTAAHCFAPL